MNDAFAMIVHMYVIAATVDIVLAVAVAVAVVMLVLAELDIVCAVVEHIVASLYLFDDIAMAMAAEVLHDLNIGDDDDDEDEILVVVWFAVACNECVVVEAVTVVDDTFHFGYLMAGCSGLLMLMVYEDVLVQCDFVDCSMVLVDQPLLTPVAAAAAAGTFVDTIPLGFDVVPVDTVLRWCCCYFDDSAVDMPELEHYSDDTELANYSDDLADGDMEPGIHLVDKLPVHYYLDGFVAVVVVPNNWHNY